MSPTINAEERQIFTPSNNEYKISKAQSVVTESNTLKQTVYRTLPGIADLQNPFIENYSLLPHFNYNLQNWKSFENDIEEEQSETSRNEWVFVNCWAVKGIASQKSKNIKIGDIVVFISPKDEYDSVIKRVVATEHQIIQTRKTCTNNTNGFGGGDVVVIPAGHCWVEGDNQETSIDSRRYGPVSVGLIFAKVSWVIYPFHHIRRLDSTSNLQSVSSTTRIIGSNGIPTSYL